MLIASAFSVPLDIKNCRTSKKQKVKGQENLVLVILLVLFFLQYCILCGKDLRFLLQSYETNSIPPILQSEENKVFMLWSFFRPKVNKKGNLELDSVIAGYQI